jgi:hypothetical protein
VKYSGSRNQIDDSPRVTIPAIEAIKNPNKLRTENHGPLPEKIGKSGRVNFSIPGGITFVLDVMV